MKKLHFYLHSPSVLPYRPTHSTRLQPTIHLSNIRVLQFPTLNALLTDLPIPTPLKPVYLNHVGRHGARFLSSSKYTTSLLRSLHKADSLRTITPMGRELINICNLVVERTAGRWGALDSLGMAEQRAIASRAFMAFRPLFDNTKSMQSRHTFHAV